MITPLISGFTDANMRFPEAKDSIGQVVLEVSIQETDILASYGLRRESDGCIGWRRDSKEHPRNWSTRRKTYDTLLIILLELYT